MSRPLATATWADPALVEEKYLYRDGTVWLGRSASDKQIPLGYNNDRHVCLVSGTRGGKGASSIITNLCLWPGSVVVVDPKGENATVTAARRGEGTDLCEGLRQLVHVLDPFNTAQVDDSDRSRFNPLDAVDPHDEEAVNRATLIADAIVVIHPESNDPFWDESGRAMVKGLVLHILTAPQYEGRRNLLLLRDLITRGDWEAVELLRQMGEENIPAAHGLLWQAVSESNALDGVVANGGATFVNMLKHAPEQFESVLQVANRNTEFIDSPGMRRCLEASDFAIADLKTNPYGLSLYLCLPQRYMETHCGWLRMMTSLIVSEMEAVKGKPATGHPVLMLLDEFAGLKRMKIIENAVAQMAGFGVKMFFVLQTLGQLKEIYKDGWETFLANAGLKLFFGLDDHFTREHVSKLIGETEVIREVHSEGDNSSESESASESRSTSRSESIGNSTSHGHSVSEGTNRSTSRSESHGTNKSHSSTLGSSYGSSDSKSWSPNNYFNRSTSSNSSHSSSTSTSEGTSESWSRSETEGSSRGSSESETEGTSHTSGTSESETSGTTRGSSRGRTSGTSETVHHRPLISPDEIGKMFARIDERDRAAYPGLGLAVMSGQEPVAFRRVNYYEDLQFIGYFEPHPDHEFSPPRKYKISKAGLEPYKSRIPDVDWVLAFGEGKVVHEGDVIAYVNGKSIKTLVPMRSPRTGRISSISTRIELGEGMLKGLRMLGSTLPGSILVGDIELLSYDRGRSSIDPFADLAAYCREMDLAKAKKDREAQERRARQAMARRLAAEREIRERRRTWLQVAGVTGVLLLADILIPSAANSVAGVVVALAAFGILCLCGWKLWQTVAEKREDKKPPTGEIPRGLSDPWLQAQIEEIRKNQVGTNPPEKPEDKNSPTTANTSFPSYPHLGPEFEALIDKHNKDLAAKTPPEKPQIPPSTPFDLMSGIALEDFRRVLGLPKNAAEKGGFSDCTPEQWEALKRVFEDTSKNKNAE